MNYHIHVYFNAVSKQAALAVRDLLAQAYPDLHLGSIHDNPVGPHPEGSFEIDVPGAKFDAVKQFLETNSHGLTMLIHGLTGDHIHDHSEDNIGWINKPAALNMDFFHRHP